jgi:hypothetical protein
MQRKNSIQASTHSQDPSGLEAPKWLTESIQTEFDLAFACSLHTFSDRMRQLPRTQQVNQHLPPSKCLPIQHSRVTQL